MKKLKFSIKLEKDINLFLKIYKLFSDHDLEEYIWQAIDEVQLVKNKQELYDSLSTNYFNVGLDHAKLIVLKYISNQK